MPAFSIDRIVEWGECDPAGLVFYPTFFRWMDHTFHAFLIDLGYSQNVLFEEYSGLTAPLIDVGCTFHAPVSYGDLVTISLDIAKVGTTSLNLLYRVDNKGQTAAEGREARVFARPNLGLIEKQPIPPEIRARFDALAMASSEKRDA
ncbi:MAG: thioesterase family protein [Pseudomonadota bacterium]